MEEGAGAESSPREPGAAGGSAERKAEGHAPPDGLNAMEKARWRIQHGAPDANDALLQQLQRGLLDDGAAEGASHQCEVHSYLILKVIL